MYRLALRFAIAGLLLGSLPSCGGECPEDQSIFIGGEEYCGDPCASCDACADGFSCQFTAGQGVCVDGPFLTERGVSTSCVDPCPSGERRYDDMGTSTCVRICTVDGECDHCCVEPPDLEITICAPRPELCM